MINQKLSGTDNNYYGTTRLELLKFVAKPVEKVLEIGCGTGATLAELKRLGAHFVCGCEINPEAAALASARPEIDRVFIGDAESTVVQLADASFDLVIASHALEHLLDPWQMTQQIHRVLRHRGQLIGTIPNVRHISVVIPLVVAGRWTYAKSGIMDWTHIRFFTRAEIRLMLQQAGFNSIRIESSVNGPLSTLLSRLSFGLLNGFASNEYHFSGENLDPTP